MNAPVAVQLGDILPSAATGKTGLHKSANKEDLSAAKGQEFSNLLLAAQEKVNGTASSSAEDLEKQGQDVKADEAKDLEPVEEDIAEVTTPSVSLPTLNAVAAQALPTLNAVVAQPLLSPHVDTTKVLKDGVDGAGDTGSADKSKAGQRAEKATTDSAPTLQAVQGKETTEAMLLPASLPNLFPTVKPESTTSDEKGTQDKSDSGGSVAAKGVVSTTAVDKVGGEYGAAAASSPAAQGLQLELSSKNDGGVAAVGDSADVAGSDADGVRGPAASATTKTASAVDLSAGKSGADGTSGVSSSANSSATSDAVRAAAAASSASDASQKAASTDVSGSVTAAASSPAASSSSSTASHDVAASVLPAAAHDVPTAPTPQTAPATMHDAGSQAPKTDGLERSASTNSGLGNTDAHALLDGSTTTGREGTWQISSNRVEAGFANDQNSWTSVVAQRQQGHVTAMLELGSAAEHSSTASMLPQLNAHLADRQLPVDQLGVSVRQQFTSGQDASAANQGQQSNQSSQSQRGQQANGAVVPSVATTPATVEGSRTGFDGNRISIRA
jgi:hypothetical protein